MTCYFGTNIRWYPAYGPNAVTFPLVYDESVSIVQQIAYLFGAYKQLTEAEQSFITQDVFNDFLVALSQDQADQTALLEEYADAGDVRTLAAAKALIDKIATTNLIYDPTQGLMADSVTAMRNLYTWLSVHAITVDQLTANVETCEALAAQNLNVRGLATWSFELVDGWTEPEGIRYVAPPEPDAEDLTSEMLAYSQVTPDGYLVVGPHFVPNPADVEDIATAQVEMASRKIKRKDR